MIEVEGHAQRFEREKMNICFILFLLLEYVSLQKFIYISHHNLIGVSL